jgi:multidrug transporter EmrE-like cation transporter
MGYLFLILTILCESAAVVFMKLSNGFQQKQYAVAAMITYAASFILLTLSLKQLQAGIANAIWAGTSTLLVAAAGVYIFNEKLNPIQIVSMLLIAVGLIGLNIRKA